MAKFAKGAGGNGRKRANIAYGKLSATRKLLRRLPEELTAPIKRAVLQGAEAVAQDAKALAPRSAEAPHAAEQIKYKIGRDGFTADVGLIGKRANKKAFYLRFFEYGTKGTEKGFGRGITLPPLPARPWLSVAFDAHSAWIREASQEAVNRAINSAAKVETDLTVVSGRVGVTDG